MPYDGLVLAAVKKELDEKLTGGRIEKIYQPGQDTIILNIYRREGRERLLLSADARDARVHLTSSASENPISPPLFCMVLRKYLEGGRITGFFQPGLERVLKICVQSYDELGYQAEKHLICEIMGKHSNIILVEPVHEMIIDGIKRYSHALSRHREVMPGRQYLAPPQKKTNPLSVDEDQFRQACLSLPLDTGLTDLLQKSFEGLSTVSAREIAHRSGLDPVITLDNCGVHEFRSLWQAFRAVLEDVRKGQFKPCVITGTDAAIHDFAAIELTHLARCQSHTGINRLLDRHYSTQKAILEINREKTRLSAVIKKELSRIRKRVGLYQETLAGTSEAEMFRLYGELLMANLHGMEKGQSEVILENFYEEMHPALAIPLDPQLTAIENAQTYFKKYRKLKAAGKVHKTMLTEQAGELDYLEGVIASLELADDLSELNEVRQELVEQKYLREATSGKPLKNKKERIVPKPLSCTSSEGFLILVGKNNKQNDYLTGKLARENDVWLHCRDIPGAHVIIKTGDRAATPTVLEEAANLAAYFSKARNAGKVPVDYTLKKNVRKPRGARPGIFIYENHKTILATPADARIIISRENLV